MTMLGTYLLPEGFVLTPVLRVSSGVITCLGISPKYEYSMYSKVKELDDFYSAQCQ